MMSVAERCDICGSPWKFVKIQGDDRMILLCDACANFVFESIDNEEKSLIIQCKRQVYDFKLVASRRLGPVVTDMKLYGIRMELFEEIYRRRVDKVIEKEVELNGC